MKPLLLLSLLVTLGASAAAQQPISPPGPCRFIGASHAMVFTPGATTENFFVTTADPEVRRFIVYVPSTYQPDQDPYPVVFMLHGTSQNASDPIQKLTWDENAEALDFIAVFPEALPYLLLDGTTRTKWATDAVASYVVDPSELPLADDAVFLRELFNSLGAHLNIDCDRVYASGFSNGGGFVKTNIRVELSDVFAATTSAGGIGVHVTAPGEFYPDNGFLFRPHFEVVGNEDENKRARCIADGDLLPGQDLPMSVPEIIARPCMWDPLTTIAGELGMDPTDYDTLEQPYMTQFVWDTAMLRGRSPREYRFRVLRNMTHEYPSGNNYPIDYVPLFYAWMNQFTR